MVNARAHQLGKDSKILNNRLHEQYHQYMIVLKYHPSLGEEDLLATAYYLFLQDRVSEVMEFFGRVRPDNVTEKLQQE